MPTYQSYCAIRTERRYKSKKVFAFATRKYCPKFATHTFQPDEKYSTGPRPNIFNNASTPYTAISL